MDFTHPRRHPSDPSRRADRERGGGEVALRGLRRHLGLYEFALDDGGVVRLHDGECSAVNYSPRDATLQVTFAFEPQWAPRTHPGGCTIRLTFTGAAILEWEHTQGPAEHSGECRDLMQEGPTLFRLDLTNDSILFTATEIRASVWSETPDE